MKILEETLSVDKSMSRDINAGIEELAEHHKEELTMEELAGL